ncbi:MAG: hypothetical protein EAZ08_07895 [Cytophagales bacterium]|nr:MAG: hypothetical protein EAZ08_07895 [Cytophagales bacterium]
MKKLSFDQMEKISGGDWENWVDGACIGWGAVRTFTVLTPATFIAGRIVDVGCIGWGIYRTAP